MCSRHLVTALHAGLYLVIQFKILLKQFCERFFIACKIAYLLYIDRILTLNNLASNPRRMSWMAFCRERIVHGFFVVEVHNKVLVWKVLSRAAMKAFHFVLKSLQLFTCNVRNLKRFKRICPSC